MKVTAKKFKTLISVTAAIFGMALQASPSAALDEEQGRKLFKICFNESCQALAELFIPSGINGQAGGAPLDPGGPWDPPTPEEKAFEAAQKTAHQREEYSVMRQGKSIWWINPSMVEAVSVRSSYERPYMDDDLYSPNWSVRYKIRAESGQGTKLVREFVGNCLTRKDRKNNMLLLSEPLLYHLGTSETDAKGNVIREERLQKPSQMTRLDPDEMYSLKVACYLAYDFPSIKAILSKGSSNDGFATFERKSSTSTSSEPSTPTRVIDLTGLE